MKADDATNEDGDAEKDRMKGRELQIAILVEQVEKLQSFTRMRH